MCQASGVTTGLIGSLAADGDRGRNALIAHSCDRLRNVASRILGEDFSRLRRWEQTDDVLQNALLRLNRALESCAPVSSAHFWNLATRLVRRELIDLTRHHFGPEGHAASHQTDHSGPADHPDPRSMRAGGCEPSSQEQWGSIHEQVEALPRELRDLVGLIWCEGLTQQQAADALGVSLNTVKRRRRTALLLLAHALRAKAAE